MNYLPLTDAQKRIIKDILDKPCHKCVNALFGTLWDPYTIEQMKIVEVLREPDLLRLHVHHPSHIDGDKAGPVITFMTYVFINPTTVIPIFTPGHRELERAFENFHKVLDREAKRVPQPSRRTRVPRRGKSPITEVDSTGTSSGT